MTKSEYVKANQVKGPKEVPVPSNEKPLSSESRSKEEVDENKIPYDPKDPEWIPEVPVTKASQIQISGIATPATQQQRNERKSSSAALTESSNSLGFLSKSKKQRRKENIYPKPPYSYSCLIGNITMLIIKY